MKHKDAVKVPVKSITSTSRRDDFLKRLKEKFVYTGQRGSQPMYLDLETTTSALTKQHLMHFLIGIGASWDEAKNILKYCDRHLRPVAEKQLYRPGQKQVVSFGGLFFLNLWQQPKVEPDTSICAAPFIEHLTMTLGSAEKANYLIDALALRFQRNTNTEKPHIAFYLYGEAQGQGKSLFARTIRQVFGDSAVRIVPSADKLKSMSAVDMWTRTWLVTEETEVKRGSELYDTIKSYTGMDRTESDRKNTHFDTYEIPAQLIMLSNNVPSFIEANDRRFFVSQWDTGLRGDQKKAYFDGYINWLDNGGFEAIAGLLKTRAITNDMYREAMTTKEKLQAQNLASDECIEALKDLLADMPKNVLFLPNDFDDVWEEHSIKGNQKKHKLAAAGLKKHTGRVQIAKERVSGLWMFSDVELVTEKGQAPKIELGVGELEDAVRVYSLEDL